MKPIIWLIFVTTVIGITPLVNAQSVISVPVPANWRTESVTLPPPFAQQVTLKGRAQVHFSPGWGEKKSDQFFTYAFLFETDAEPKLDKSVITKELLAYYGGLAKAVSRGKVDPKSFKLTIKDVKHDSTNTKRFAATLDWTEPFFTRQSQKLNLEIDTFYDTKKEKNYLLVCASPQDPKNEKEPATKVWKELRKIRDDFNSARFKKSSAN